MNGSVTIAFKKLASPILPAKLLLLLITFMCNSHLIYSATFPILPEFQVYHTVGNRGSSYSTGAMGFSLHLYDEPGGPGRYLQFLALQIPQKTLGWNSRIGDLFLSKNGTGYEIAVHDQWVSPAGKGATLALRKIQWPEVQAAGVTLGEASSDTLHMGWSWVSGKPIITVWLLGLDISSLNLPDDRQMEAQLALGMRTVF